MRTRPSSHLRAHTTHHSYGGLDGVWADCEGLCRAPPAPVIAPSNEAPRVDFVSSSSPDYDCDCDMEDCERGPHPALPGLVLPTTPCGGPRWGMDGKSGIWARCLSHRPSRPTRCSRRYSHTLPTTTTTTTRTSTWHRHRLRVRPGVRAAALLPNAEYGHSSLLRGLRWDRAGWLGCEVGCLLRRAFAFKRRMVFASFLLRGGHGQAILGLTTSSSC